MDNRPDDPSAGPIWRQLLASLGRYSDIGRNISWLGAAMLLVKPLWFVFIAVMCVRVLGGAGYGQLMAALSLSAICFSFASFGTDEFTVREVSRRPETAALFFSNFIVLRLGLFAIGTALAALVGLVLGYEQEMLMAVGFACLYQAMNFLTVHSRKYFRVFERLKFEGASVVLEKVAVILAGSAFLLLTRSVYLTLAGMAIGMAAAGVFTTSWTARKFASFDRSLLSFQFARDALRRSVPFGLAALFTLFYLRADLVMLEHMIGDLYAGQYGLAYRLMEALNILPVVVAEAAVFPRMARNVKDGELPAFVHLVRTSFGGLLALSLGIAVLMYFLAPTIIHLISTAEEFAPAGPALQILCWTFPMACARIVLYVALLALERQRFIASALGLAMVINIGLNYWLIPIMGITGACAATLAAEAILLGTYLVRYRVDERRLGTPAAKSQ